MEIIGLKIACISQPRIATKSSFLASGCFLRCFFQISLVITSDSHNFTNSSFCDVTLYHSVATHMHEMWDETVNRPNHIPLETINYN